MDDKEKEVSENNGGFMDKVIESAIYTFFIFLFTIYGVSFIINLLWHDRDTGLIISFCISIIFTMLYCTLTIIDKIKKIK